MINIANVSQASAMLVTDTVLTTQGVTTVNAAMKANWDTLIEMTYSLIYPKIHRTFIETDELQLYITKELNSAFATHHASNVHFWPGGNPGFPGATSLPLCQLAIPFMKNVPLMKMTRPTSTMISVDPTVAMGEDSPNLELSMPSFQAVQAYALSPVNQFLVT